MPRKYRKRKRSFRKRRRSRGMQRIRTVRYRQRNIGGDRAVARLFYSTSATIDLLSLTSSTQLVWCPNIGATDVGTFNGVHRTFGTTSGLSVLAAQYLRYRIRGVKLRYTIYPVQVDLATAVPVNVYVNALPSGVPISGSTTGPTPPFSPLATNVTPEQRWAKWAPVRYPMAGATPTVLKAYFSVNKVFGPDVSVGTDESFIGQLQTASPYWDTTAFGHPVQGIWIQHGVSTMNDLQATANQRYIMNIQATFYTQFFGRRFSVA